MTQANPGHQAFLVGVYGNEAEAKRVVEQLIGRDYPMDQLSVLGRVHASGDDALGIYHAGAGERMKVWAKQGALWGALGGLLAGAAGMFVLPPIGAVLAAGPIAEAIVAVLEGAAVGGAAMTGAAAVTHLATALRRIGIPEEKLDHLHQAIMEGHYVVVLHGKPDRIEQWKPLLGRSAREIVGLP
ncbi:MAG: hypothetical protein PHX38_12595 [Sulfuricella sp.]|nr:hypothetical protein [Sulfuricella sp.]